MTAKVECKITVFMSCRRRVSTVSGTVGGGGGGIAIWYAYVDFVDSTYPKIIGF